MSFAEKVKYVRAKLLISQTALAKEVGVSFETVNRWETGKLQPSFLNEKRFETFCREHNIKMEDRF